MTADDKRPTLADAKKIANTRAATSRPSDFLSDEEQQELKEANSQRKRKKRFTYTDSITAEIIARFGYDAYLAWCNKEISMEDMLRYLNAERAREKANMLALEAIILSIGTSCAQPRGKNKGIPKGLKMAFKILKDEERKAGNE